MGNHALLSASSSHRWLNCPPSARLCEGYDDKENNDWLAHFLNDCCEVDTTYSEKSSDLYNAYRSYCMQVGEYIRGTTDFYVALESAGGFDRRRTSKANMIIGLRLKSDFMK